MSSNNQGHIFATSNFHLFKLRLFNLVFHISAHSWVLEIKSQWYGWMCLYKYITFFYILIKLFFVSEKKIQIVVTPNGIRVK